MHMLKGGKLYRSGKVSMLETGLNDREMITSLIKLTLSAIIITMEKWKHLTWCLNCIIFYDQNILTKHVTRQTHFVIAKFKKLRILKEKDKKNSGIISLTEVLIFWTANTFSQLNLVFIVDSRTGFRSRIFWKYKLNVRSSHWSFSVKNGVLKYFANFTGNTWTIWKSRHRLLGICIGIPKIFFQLMRNFLKK